MLKIASVNKRIGKKMGGTLATFSSAFISLLLLSRLLLTSFALQKKQVIWWKSFFFSAKDVPLFDTSTLSELWTILHIVDIVTQSPGGSKTVINPDRYLWFGITVSVVKCNGTMFDTLSNVLSIALILWTRSINFSMNKWYVNQSISIYTHQHVNSWWRKEVYSSVWIFKK